MRGRVWFWAVAGAGAAADLVTKYLAFRNIGKGEVVQVIPGILNLTCSLNRGGVWGIGQGKSGWFILFSLIAAGFVIWLSHTTPRSRLLTHIALGAVLGGAIGNLYDRLQCGAVRDFVDVYWGRRHWPTFNVADALICIAVGLMMIEVWRGEPRDTAASAGAEENDASEKPDRGRGQA